MTYKWEEVTGSSLMQGDILVDCIVPIFDTDYNPENIPKEGIMPIDFVDYDLIILTQSCDLANEKTRLVATCPVHKKIEFQTVNPLYKSKNKWKEIEKGKILGLYLLPPLPSDESEDDHLIVNFREIYSLPYSYLTKRAISLGMRWRLCSPFREHLSSSFGNFFSRVALPGP